VQTKPSDPAVNSARYSKFMAGFHWLMAILVILAYLTSEGGPDVRENIPTVHVLCGLSVLLLVLPRLLVRLLGGVPSPLATISKRLTRMASIGHATLYLLLFAVPITGWFTLSRLGLKVELLGLKLPFLIEPTAGDPGLIADVHQIGGNVLLGIAGLHAAFAIWHFVWLRDKTLQRMWPF
jgi:superoxide oxidase